MGWSRNNHADSDKHIWPTCGATVVIHLKLGSECSLLLLSHSYHVLCLFDSNKYYLLFTIPQCYLQSHVNEYCTLINYGNQVQYVTGLTIQ